MNPKTEKKKNYVLLKTALGLLIALIVSGLYVLYNILPQKVAEGIVAKAQVRQPLTETPKDYGVIGYQDVSFTEPNGVTISGWWLPVKSPQKSAGTILLTHGVFKNRQQVLSRAVFLWKMGYQVLLFDLRGEGLSGPSPVSGGLLESNDFLAGEKFLEGKKELKKPVIFFGLSLGAMSALRAGVKASPLDAIIADSPLSSIRSYVSRRTVGGAFSSMPGFLSQCLKDYDKLTGLSLNVQDMDLIPVVEKLGDTPVLYITGENDDLAKSNEVQQLFQHTPAAHRRLVYMPDSGHEETYKKYPMIYEKLVREFLTDLKNGFPKKEDFPAQPGKK
jgi:alpha-beta hydrolase superfamily lysophospholipase